MTVSKILSQLNRSETEVVSRSAEVSAIREDGKVNLRYQGAVILGAVCLRSYQNRTIGDRVHTVYSDGQWVVLGEYGPDITFNLSSFGSSYYYNYNAVTGTVMTTNKMSLPQMGCTGLGTDTVPMIAAWSYYNTISNVLTDLPAAQPIRLWLARDTQDGGIDDAVTVHVYPHGYNTLPASGFTYDNSPTRTSVVASLQSGQVIGQYLPSDWISDIEAGTIKGFCAVPDQAADPLVSYCQFSLTAGSYNSP